MPPLATGSIVERKGKDGRIYRSLRFRAGGKRYTEPLGVIKRADAEKALRQTMAKVDRGEWRPPEPVPAANSMPSFHEFSETWWTLNQARLAPSTQEDYRWRLEVHLIPYFGRMRLDEITFARIEEYRAAKEGEDDRLSPRSINMTITLLGAILERALKRNLIDSNPARDRDLRAPERTPARSYLDAAEQIQALLEAAGEMDGKASFGRRHIERRAMVATLVFAGLRIGELFSLRWRDVDLAGGWLQVGESKTDAGRRRVKIRGVLRDELLTMRGRHQEASQADFVFATRTGSKMSAENFRSRVLGRAASDETPATGAVGIANAHLEARGLAPLPERITPHSLRRTFCSLLYALGEDPGVVMDEMGHTDPALALRVYRQAMRRDERARTALARLVYGASIEAPLPGAREDFREISRAREVA
jgi:integrase